MRANLLILQHRASGAYNALYNRMDNTLAPGNRINVTVETRRQRLMTARRDALARRDWPAMNAITMRLAKLPVKTSKGTYRYGE